MPQRRRMQRGSFAAHLDELVKHFPGHAPDHPAERQHKRNAGLQEKIDIHARLFEQAWELDNEGIDGGSIQR